MTEPRNERIPDELEPEVEDGRDEADQSDGLEMDSSWESMLIWPMSRSWAWPSRETVWRWSTC